MSLVVKSEEEIYMDITWADETELNEEDTQSSIEYRKGGWYTRGEGSA